METGTLKSNKRSISDVHPVFQYALLKRLLECDPMVKWDMDRGNDPELKKISKSLETLHRPFALGGELTHLSVPDDEYYWKTTHVKDINLLLKNGESLGTLANLDLAKIEAHATQAPFGKGTETVVDTSVRNAFEIPASDFDPKIIELIANAIQYELNDLAPGEGEGAFDINFYKMHVYHKGGFFAIHADTLHAKNHMATLVVCLPMKHSGGQLTVKNDQQSHVFDFSAGISSKPKIVWGAFYTDCMHEVAEVTEGTRVVLQYDLMHREKYKSKGNKNEKKTDKEKTEDEDDQDDDDDDEDPVRTEEIWFERGSYRSQNDIPKKVIDKNHIAKTIETYWSRHPNVQLGVLLTHRYATTSLYSSYLKGTDKSLYDLAVSRGWSTQLKSIVLNGTSYHSDYSDDYDEYYAYPFDIEDIDALKKHRKIDDSDSEKEESEKEESENEDEDDGETTGEQKKDDKKLDTQTDTQKTIILVPTSESYLTCLHHSSFIEHTGNESAPEENTYFSAAILLSPPQKK